MKKIFTLCFMIMLLTMVLFVKHLRAQSLWAENSKTNQREYFTINQQISYKLNTSTNFHKARITGFTDSTLTVQIKGDKLVTIGFKKLKAFKIPRSSGRITAGALVTALGAISLIAGIGATASHSTSPPTNSSSGNLTGNLNSAISNTVNGEISIAGIAVGLITLPIGIALLQGKTIDLNKNWTLKAK